MGSWGRTLYFEYDRMDHDAYRRGYSFFPQSDAALLMNQQGLKPMHRWMKGREGGKLHLHNHDELVFSVKPEIAYDATRFLVESLERPRSYYGVELSVPCEVQIWRTWEGATEWKRMPTREEFEDEVRSLDLVAGK